MDACFFVLNNAVTTELISMLFRKIDYVWTE